MSYCWQMSHYWKWNLQTNRQMLNTKANVSVLPFVRGTSAAPFHVSFLQSLADLCKFLRLENEQRKKQLVSLSMIPHWPCGWGRSVESCWLIPKRSKGCSLLSPMVPQACYNAARTKPLDKSKVCFSQETWVSIWAISFSGHVSHDLSDSCIYKMKVIIQSLQFIRCGEKEWNCLTVNVITLELSVGLTFM